jgi:NAD-dependent SIR2 family protein deacetylase
LNSLLSFSVIDISVLGKTLMVPIPNLSDVSVVILGAGFSFAVTDGKMPLMCNFFHGIDKTSYPLLSRFVEAVDGNIETANIEQILLVLDQINSSPKSVLEGWAEEWSDNQCELRKQMTEYCCMRFKAGFDIPIYNWAASILASCGPNTTVITMNYDNLAERILSNRGYIIHHGSEMNCPHCKMKYLLHRACNCSARENLNDDSWRGSLLKLHGSITWGRCLNEKCCNHQCLVPDELCRPFQPCCCRFCGELYSPVMVMPTMSKNLNEIPEIKIMWQSARKAISDAESIFIFGFSLPSSDELLIQMIRNSIHCNKKLKRLSVIDRKPDKVIERFKRCIPDDYNLNVSQYVVSSVEPPEWFVSPFISTIYVM